jgi:LacI family transcriptional regulator
MKKDAVRLKDIAIHLNLSISTVSKALKRSYEISEETRKKVLEYAQEVNYVPNPMAQGLRKGNSKIIAVIVPNIDNNFFSQVINGIESIAFEKGYNVIITQTHESYEREVFNAHHHFSRSVDGLLVSLSAETRTLDHFESVHSKGLPIVFFDRIPEAIKTVKVVSNNFKGGYEATEHLIREGFTRIAHMTSSESLSITRERLAGYRSALVNNNRVVDENLIKYCIHGGMVIEEVYEAIGELLSLKDPPDAIVTASDRLSINTFDILFKMKIKIPDEIGLVGFTNSIASNIFNPSFTSVVQLAFEMGVAATEALIKIIERKRRVIRGEKLILDTDLIKLESSRKTEMSKPLS